MASSSQTDEQLSVALLNINGLRDETSYVQYMIVKHKLHVVALCETKLDTTVKDSKVSIEGFRMWRKDRNSYGGGVALYVQEHIETRLRLDLIKTRAEMIWVEMKLPDSKSVLLGCCYRAPDAKVEYLDQIKEIMTLASNEKEEKDILLMGDFNLNWEITEDRNRISFMSHLGFKQIVDDYTRVKPEKDKKTIIDHIYTNIEELTSQRTKPKSNVTHISDHNYITVTINRNIPKWTQSCRQNQGNKNFKTEIEKEDWGDVSEKSDLKEALSVFTRKLIQKLNDCAPSSPLKKDIYDLMRIRNDLRANYSDEDVIKEKTIKNYLENGTKETFRRNKKRERTSDGEEEKQKKLTELQILVEVFEVYLGESLPSRMISITPEGVVLEAEPLTVNLHHTKNGSSDSVPGTDGSKPRQRTTMTPDASIFRKTDDKTVKRWLERLCNHVIHKIDENEAKLIKDVADQISDPICHIVNKCISSKQFPDELKKIKTFRFSPNSYISSKQINAVDRVHLMLSYILDGILYKQVKEFCQKNHLIPGASLGEVKPTQNVCLIASEMKKKVGAVFLDLNSSFNTISHDLLKKTLRTSGFSASDCSLIESFFSSRGLPSGSVLGQLLYKIFINDLKTVLTKPSAVVRDDRVEFSLLIQSRATTPDPGQMGDDRSGRVQPDQRRENLTRAATSIPAPRASSQEKEKKKQRLK